MKSVSKLLLLSLLVISSSQAMEELSSGKLTKIKKSSLFAREEVGKFSLFHSDKEGFIVDQENEQFYVERHAVDHILRNANNKQLEKLQKVGYIQVKKNNQNKFGLSYQPRLNGGGAGGATTGFWVGKWATHLAAQTVYAVAAGAATIATGGNVAAGAVVWASLQATFAVPVETASNVVACGSAILLGASTGPV